MWNRSSAWGDLRLFFGLTFLLSWGVGGLYLLSRSYFEPILGPLDQRSIAFIIINCAPTIAALMTAIVRGGLVGLWTLIGSLFRPFAWYWLIIAALFVPVIALALSYGAPYWQPNWPVAPHQVFVDLPLLMFTTAQILLNIAPFGEELGWRGYALPRLIDRTNAIVAALILGAVWVIWHIPGFFIEGVMASSFALFGWWALGTMALSMIMTFLYVRANGNVIVAGVIPHFVINAAANAGVWESRPAEVVSLAVVAVALAIALAISAHRQAQRGTA